MTIKFQNNAHRDRFCALLVRMKCRDCYHIAAAYLMALADLVPTDVFDFSDDKICPNGIFAPWQTASTLKATRLMFNLWNGWAFEEDFVIGDSLIASTDYTVNSIFCNSEYAPYFWVAVRLRFGYA